MPKNGVEFRWLQIPVMLIIIIIVRSSESNRSRWLIRCCCCFHPDKVLRALLCTIKATHLNQHHCQVGDHHHHHYHNYISWIDNKGGTYLQRVAECGGEIMNVNIYARYRICLKGHLGAAGWLVGLQTREDEALRVAVAERMMLIPTRWQSYLF